MAYYFVMTFFANMRERPIPMTRVGVATPNNKRHRAEESFCVNVWGGHNERNPL